ALVPAYLAPWFGGRQFTSLEIGSVRAALSMAGVLLAGSTVSFLISNGSFYLFSGYYNEPSLAEYARRAVQYYPGHISSAFMYVTLAVIARKAGTALTRAENRLGSART
ncbi:MAG: hypothetical protein HZA02_07785, partial [Nitrospinae bacterium]|nr:hypothetical protein [Nitrospinota bacterium]